MYNTCFYRENILFKKYNLNIILIIRYTNIPYCSYTFSFLMNAYTRTYIIHCHGKARRPFCAQWVGVWIYHRTRRQTALFEHFGYYTYYTHTQHTHNTHTHTVYISARHWVVEGGSLQRVLGNGGKKWTDFFLPEWGVLCHAGSSRSRPSYFDRVTVG